MPRCTTRSSTSRKRITLGQAIVPALLLPLCAPAQSIQVYSEFTRIDPFGKIIAADRGSNEPREVLSPALPRNAITSFHIVVSGEPGSQFMLYVGQNPDDAAAVTVYRENYTKVRDSWIPDSLEPIALPYLARLGSEQIPNQSAQSFWVDFRISRDAPVRRVKLEPLAMFGSHSVPYPMEGRVITTTLPDRSVRPPGPAPIEAPLDFTARRALKQKLCGVASESRDVALRDLTIR